LRDSIRDGVTGILCEHDPNSLAAATLRFLDDPSRREMLTLNALKWSRDFSWDETAISIRKLLRRVLNG
jgi:glycosyltransferase involved in cell wall biosynthesis